MEPESTRQPDAEQTGDVPAGADDSALVRELDAELGNEPSGEVTELLRAWRGGDRSVENRLFSLVFPDLRRLAHKMTSGERSDNSLHATALINEAYMKLVKGKDRDWEGRTHFFRVAAHAMRCLLIDHARSRTRAGVKLQIEGLEELLRGRDEQLDAALAIESLLDELGAKNAEWLTIIEMRVFAGMTLEEVSEATRIPKRTLQRSEADARYWLFERMRASGYTSRETPQ
jgi:RNA polymerase sigma factor (TIGR02999 family)